MKQFFKDYVKRAYVKYTVTEEIKIRKQLQIISPVGADLFCNVNLYGTSPPGFAGCSPAVNAGGLTWEPGTAKEDKNGRAKAEGPKQVGDWKAGSAISSSVSPEPL